MNKILVTYATNSGSTAEVAKAVMEEIQKSGAQVELLPIAEVRELDAYSAVVLGAPMIMGWHREAVRFLHKNKKALANMPLAVFVTCMSLTKSRGNDHSRACRSAWMRTCPNRRRMPAG